MIVLTQNGPPKGTSENFLGVESRSKWVGWNMIQQD